MLPLQGLRIVVTRAAHQAQALAEPLQKLGAEVIFLPVIEIARPVDPVPLQQAACEANQYDWIIFTSANAIEAFLAELPFKASQCRAHVATVGAATRKAAERSAFKVEVTPERYVAESLLDALSAYDLQGCRILIPTSEIARDLVPAELRGRGARVDVVIAYRNILPPDAQQRVAEILRDPFPDWVTFASSSAVDHLVELAGLDALGHMKIATIGPVTSDTVRKYGLAIAAEASPSTAEGLIKAIVNKN